MVRKNLHLLSSFLRFDRKCSELGPPLITITGSTPGNLHFLSVIFDQQLKITFRKSSGPPEKTTPLFLLTPPPKNSKSACPPPSLPTLKIFQGLLQKGGMTLWIYLQSTQNFEELSIVSGRRGGKLWINELKVKQIVTVKLVTNLKQK